MEQRSRTLIKPAENVESLGVDEPPSPMSMEPPDVPALVQRQVGMGAFNV